MTLTMNDIVFLARLRTRGVSTSYELYAYGKTDDQWPLSMQSVYRAAGRLLKSGYIDLLSTDKASNGVTRKHLCINDEGVIALGSLCDLIEKVSG